MIDLTTRCQRTCVALFAGAGLLLGMVQLAGAGRVPSAVARSLAFPVSLANGIAGDLVPPAGSSTKLSFESGKVAVGELPVPLPQRPGRRRRAGEARTFFRPSDDGPHVRMLLNGVVDADGAVTNSHNQLMIDAVVSPSSAALSSPPFVVPFDIKEGTAFVDAPLPIQNLADGSVRIQILGVTVVDPEGQPFGVLGFQLPPAPGTPVPRFTPTPSGTPPVQDVNCADRSVCAGRCTRQCSDGRVESGVCRAAATCECSASCDAVPTPSPGPCADAANCSGACVFTCPDGTTVAGKCLGDSQNVCSCSAECHVPTPCGAGQCFDTLTFHCTGQSCGPGLHCPLPNQLCDVSGRFCPCEPPPPPAHGTICCQCKEPAAACFNLQFADVQPICPRGCETFAGQQCDGRTGHCLPLTPCTSDKDCDDQNGCTQDRCTADGCVHDCLCVGPQACGPGPGGQHHR